MAAVLAVLALGGCSYVPDALNPVEWYRSTVDFFSDDKNAEGGLKADPNAPQDASKPAEKKDFPKVSEVPSAPPSGLSGDAGGRRYASDVVAGQSAAVAPLRPGERATAEAPPPPAVPVAPVAQAAPKSTPKSTHQATRTMTPPKAPAMPTTPSSTAEAPKAPAMAMPANAEQPMLGSDYGTVVISSDGIEQGGASAAAPAGGERRLPAAPTTASSGRPAMPTPGPAGSYDLASGMMPVSGTVKVATILFDNGSAQLNAEDVRILQEVRAIHQQRGGVIRVVGHASSRTRDMDPVQHKMANLQVSVDRADMVAKTLVKMGTPANQVAVNAVADTHPVYYEVMPAGEAGNRRAEIFITY